MKFFLILVFGVSFTFGCNENTQNGSKSAAAGSGDIEKVELYTLQGESIDLSKYKGKGVFVNFWATWCKPCVEEMPTIKNAIENLKNKNIEFLFASDETTEEIEAFERQHQFGFNFVRIKSFDELGIMGLPTTFIFDKEGRKMFSEIGYRKWDERTNLDILLQSIK